MPLLNFIPAPTWRDLVDILFLTLVAYQLYEWFRETRALRVLIGLVVLGGIYSVAKLWGLFLTTWVFQVNLKGLAAGKHSIRLTGKNVDLPSGLKVEQITPQSIEITLPEDPPAIQRN